MARFGAPQLSSPEAIRRIEVSGQGQVLTCGSRHVRLWQGATGKLLWHTIATQGDAHCALSPNGSVVAVSQGDVGGAQIQLIDWQTGSTTTVQKISSGRVFGFAFSLDSRRVVALDGGITLREVTSDTVVASTRGLASTAGFSADGTTIIAVGGDKVLRWKPADADKKVEVVATLPGRNMSASLSSGAALVAWASGAVAILSN